MTDPQTNDNDQPDTFIEDQEGVIVPDAPGATESVNEDEEE